MRAAPASIVLLALASPTAGQFTMPDPPAEVEPTPAADAPRTGRFTAEWPLPPADQIDREMRSYAARYQRTPDAPRHVPRMQQIAAEQQAGGATHEYSVYVPESYDPARPPGVIAFISAGDGADTGGQYRQVLDDRNLIWISPADAGNKADVPWREWSATQAVRAVRERYAVDEDRVYAGGFSGGGRVASRLGVIGSDFFDGVLALCGANYFGEVPSGEGTHWDGFWPRPDRQLLQHAMRNVRHVFVTGSEDFNRDQSRRNVEQGRRDGFQMIAYVEQPGLGHGFPDAGHFEEAVALLDSPLAQAAAEALARAETLEAGRPGEALGLYRRASLHAGLAPDGDDAAATARAKAANLSADLAAAVAEAEAKIDAGEIPAAARALRDLRRWSPAADAEVGHLAAALRNARRR